MDVDEHENFQVEDEEEEEEEEEEFFEEEEEEEDEDDAGIEFEAESPSSSDSPGRSSRKNSVGSVASRTELRDSEEEEEAPEEEKLDDVEAPGTSEKEKPTEQPDKGDEADSESGEVTQAKASKNKKKKSPKKSKKKRRKKKEMNQANVIISEKPKKRARPQPNKRKKIRKLLLENQLQEETLQALREEEERRKRLGLFMKEDTVPSGGNGVSFEPLDDAQFPDISCNLDFMDNLDLDITPLNDDNLGMLPVLGESETSSCLAELKGADVKDVLRINTTATKTSALHSTTSTDSLNNDVTRLGQLLRADITDGKGPGNEHIPVSMETEPTMNGTVASVKNQNGALTENVFSHHQVSEPPIYSTSQLPGVNPPTSLPPDIRTSIADPFSLSSLMTYPNFMGLDAGFQSIQTIPHSSDRFTGFKTPTTLTAKPASSEVICISSESSDEEKMKQKQQQTVLTKSRPIETINISSGSESSSDDVIFAGTDDHEIDNEETDMNNSGMHVDDSMNVPDEEGRVLVNKNRPPTEQEIYLAPRLARAVKPHQIGGIRFMYDNIVESLEQYKQSNGFGCILAHSMGLGKTLQVISFIDVFLRYTEGRTALVVVPVNTLLNWIGEFEMWLPVTKDNNEDPSEGKTQPRRFKVRLLCDTHKTTKARAHVISSWKSEGGVLLMGYEMFRLLTNQKSRRRKKKKQNNGQPGRIIETIDLGEEDKMAEITSEIYENLVQPGPDLIVCDEGHRIKNSHASISQALKQIATRRRIVLTGYPLQNNLMEYWCMVDFVRPNFLGAKQEFSNMFERPICNGQCADSNEADIRLMRFRSHVLHSLLKGFVQRRSHLVLRNSLPPKEEYVLLIRLSHWQKKLYNNFIKQQKEQGSGSWCSTLNPIKAFSICCKIWNHPDVLYRAVARKTFEEQQSSEPNGILDMDLDLPDSVMESILKKARRKREARAEKAAEAVAGSGGKLMQSVGLSPFGEEKDKGMNYDWAIDLLQDYSPNKLEFSGKMLILVEIITHSITSGDKILVFSQSLTTLTLIEEFLSEMDVPNPPNYPQVQRKWRRNDSYFRLDGNTNTADREKMIHLFNDKTNYSINLFLLSTRAGCLGINLVGANRVVVFDISWNPCHDAQAVCRVYRYGQVKKCVIYRLICDQSMEKKIYDRQISKQGMSDRVVDELNPVRSIERQDVSKLLVYDDEDLPHPDIDECIQEVNDGTLKHTCKMFGQWLTKKPFYHESLLMDCKGSRLTKAEKRAAQKGYEHEKRASNSCNYSRPSYSNFYAAAGYPSKTSGTSRNGPASKTPITMPSTMTIPDGQHPQHSTPFSMEARQNMGLGTEARDSQIISALQRYGIQVRRTLATQDIPLPQSSIGPHSKPLVAAGEEFFMINGSKGLYIGTMTGRIFALRSQKVEEKKPQSPLVQGPGGQMVTSREKESQIIKTAFNAMAKHSGLGRHGIRNSFSMTAMSNHGGFPSSFGHSQSEGNLVNMMTGQNFPHMLSQNPMMTQQRPIMSHQMNMVNQQNDLMSHNAFHAQSSSMQNETTLQNDEHVDAMTHQNGQLESTASGLTPLQGQMGMTQPNFASLNYPMVATPNFQGNPYGVSGYFNSNWMNPHQQNGTDFQSNGGMPQLSSMTLQNGDMSQQQLSSVTQQQINMTQQNENMSQQLLQTNGDIQPALTAVDHPTNGDEPSLHENMIQQNGAMIQQNGVMIQQNGAMSQQYLPSTDNLNSKETDMDCLADL